MNIKFFQQTRHKIKYVMKARMIVFDPAEMPIIKMTYFDKLAKFFSKRSKDENKNRVGDVLPHLE